MTRDRGVFPSIHRRNPFHPKETYRESLRPKDERETLGRRPWSGLPTIVPILLLCLGRTRKGSTKSTAPTASTPGPGT